MNKGKYNTDKEYINIEGYSPFSHINEVSSQYRKDPFDLLFVSRFSDKIPIHPDTFCDLNFKEQDIVSTKMVYPTSSFRTVYEPEENICYKLPLLRKITRSQRGLSNKELLRSEKASDVLSKYAFKGFSFLAEECHHFPEDNFNYIIRQMPQTECFPWFYVISSQEYDKEFEMKCASNIIRSWMFFASKGIFFESYHTQNILVDKDAHIYYRDLSDVRSNLELQEDAVLLPSYYSRLSGVEELLSIAFDRSVCKQNLDHLFNYSTKLGIKEEEELKEIIRSEIKAYGLQFPDYSMDYPKDKTARIPEKIPLVKWRS